MAARGPRTRIETAGDIFESLSWHEWVHIEISSRCDRLFEFVAIFVCHLISFVRSTCTNVAEESQKTTISFPPQSSTEIEKKAFALFSGDRDCAR